VAFKPKKGAPGTNIYVVLDRSGSMQPLTSDTIGGFNEWLAKQKEAGANQRLTLTLFADDVRTPYAESLIGDVKPLNTASYQATGPSTSLLDAIGKTVAKVNDNGIDKVLFLVMTDGQENSSREFKKADIQKLIETKQATGWQFIYIGSDPAGFADAQTMGYSGTFVVNSLNHNTYSTLGNATVGYSSSDVLRGSATTLTQADLDAKDKGTK